MESLSEPFKDKILLNHEVINIDYSEKPIKVTYKLDHSKEDQIITCDYVISSIPIGVIKQNHQKLFTPKLDQNRVIRIFKFNLDLDF